MNLQKQKKGQSCSLVAGSQALSQTQMGIVSPSSQLSPCDTHFQRAQGNMGVESGLQSRCFWLILRARNKTLESWVYLEELRIDVSCGLVHRFLFSDREEVLVRALPSRLVP